ncbi:MAG: hypothetical protein ACK5LP_03855, partial [Campylobacteraceae bacterium]
LLISAFCITSIFALTLNLFAYDEFGSLFEKSYFYKSSPCKDCPIKLIDENEKVLLTSQTDENGEATIKLPAAKFSIIVEGSMGHQQIANYEAISHTKSSFQTLPSDAPLDKILLGLAIIALFFGGLFWFKKTVSKKLHR